MTLPQFSRYNQIAAIASFLIALITYSLTVEPTVSFWDAGEYITTGSMLQVGHPPGAPLYQMLAAFVSTLAPGPEYVALAVNMLSVISSAAAIYFLYLSISLIVRFMLERNGDSHLNHGLGVIGASFIGAVAFTFTDSFWFSAGEAEVYAMASFLMAVLFYLGLLWFRDMHAPRGNRWLLLISFLVGCTFGVHFMGLLTIPAIGYLYYFKNYKVTVKSFLVATAVVVGTLLFIFKLLLPLTLSFFSGSEIFFINSIGLPFNSGTIIAFLVVIGLFYWLFSLSRKRNNSLLQTITLCIAFILIGFSSWIMLPIRANAGTPINENNPNNARELLAYYNREQYPETHLFYGPQFTDIYGGLDKDEPFVDDKPKYEKDEVLGKYVIVNDWKDAKQNGSDVHKAYFPRMWNPERAGNYMKFMGGLDVKIKPGYEDNADLVDALESLQYDFNIGKIDDKKYVATLRRLDDYVEIQKPSYVDNTKFLFQFQMGYMYWRYFMWNFTGRQDDIQGEGDMLHGNWISGISWIDEIVAAPQDNLDRDARENKGRNTYYFLPLLLGIVGLVFHASKDVKGFWVTMVFFLFTGLALKVYLNEDMYQVRERDYALVGSFYVFAIWIGIGCFALYDLLKEYMAKVAAPVAIAICLIVPGILAAQNWDDHDRSDRKTALSMAKMYLDSCDDNAIMFTIGDNDTFALWYAQEVLGYRTDVRIINTSLLATDWYMDDMKRQVRDSDPVPSQLVHKKYRYGTRDNLWYEAREDVPDTLGIKQLMNWIASDSRDTQVQLMSEEWVHTFPAKNILLPVDKDNVLASGIVADKDRDKIESVISFQIKEDILYKNTMLMLDILANNDWKRPIYFSGGSFNDSDYLWMKEYLQLDGVAFKLVPIRTETNRDNPYELGRIDYDKSYELWTKFDWGNSNGDIYHDTETRQNAITYRANMNRVALGLIQEGKFDKAEEILDLALEKMPIDTFQFYTLLRPFVTTYARMGRPEKAKAVYAELATMYQDKVDYMASWPDATQRQYAQEIITTVEQYRAVVQELIIADADASYIEEQVVIFNENMNRFPRFYEPKEALTTENPLDRERTLDSIRELMERERDVLSRDSIEAVPLQDIQ